MQNELLQMMANRILREIAASIRGRPFAIMVDETTDVSTQEQCVIVLRWVDNHLEPHEDFIGLHSTASTDANSIVTIIKDVLVRMNTRLNDCRGQCYDGTAVMRGCRNGVAVQQARDEPRALYTHCYGHSLNLACQDTIRDIKPLKDAIDTAFELSKLLKYSAKRSAEFKRIHAEMAPEEPGFRTLCPTRWTVRAASLQSIRKNYTVLQSSLDSFSEMARRDPEMSARCSGIAAQFHLFHFFFGVSLGEKVLSLADNLSKSLQHQNLSAAQGQAMASLTLQSLRDLRTDEVFSSFWKMMMTSMEDADIAEPSLPRKRNVPARFEIGSSAGHVPATIEDHYHSIFFNAFDTIMQCISSRFDQPGYKTYSKLEAILLKGSAGKCYEDELTAVMQLYSKDLEEHLLQTQLLLLRSHFKNISPPERASCSRRWRRFPAHQ